MKRPADAARFWHWRMVARRNDMKNAHLVPAGDLSTSDPVASWTLHKRRVLVPFDFSDASRKALNVARTFVPDLGTPTGGTVSVIHVIVPPPITAIGIFWQGPFDEAQAVAEGLSALRKDLVESGAAGFDAIVRVSPHPAEEIVDFAERDQSDLIVISSHARKGFDR